eukprot:s1508_g34.t2
MALEMEDESKDPTFAPGFPSAEQRLSSLKPYAHLAWEECKAPVGDGSGSAQLRWEVFNTWMLLLSLHHVEAERERCERWKCEAWNNEAQAMRHLFMRNYHLRALQAILRWLRWSHRWAPSQAERKEEFSAYTAGYERTRRAQQLRRLPSPVQACSIVHPDGPLQNSEQFQPADLEDERQLLADLWTCLRRGELSKGLKLCAESGQAWRTALLQGMMPFAKADNVSYDIAEAAGPDEETEEMLCLMKEEHTDWTEFGQPKHYSHGNPWRKLWKEQCFDSAAWNLQSGSTMDLCELSIYGFCSGNYDALMPYCGTFWADRCWGELHCIKEWLVERLLEDGHAWCGEASLCEIDEDPDERDIRTRKLCGRLDARLSPDLGRAIAEEVQQALSRVFPRTSGDAYWEVPESVSEQFSLLQLTVRCTITACESELISPVCRGAAETRGIAMTDMTMRPVRLQCTYSLNSNDSLDSAVSTTSSQLSTSKEPRQLLLLLSSQRVENALRSARDSLRVKTKESLLLKILAEVHALWKLREAWGSKPDESWGIFLQHLSDILAPRLTCRSVALIQDWRAVKEWCIGFPPETLGEVIEAALRFHQSPTPIQVVRLSSVLDRMHQ